MLAINFRRPSLRLGGCQHDANRRAPGDGNHKISRLPQATEYQEEPQEEKTFSDALVNFTICDSDYSQAFVIDTVQAHVLPPKPARRRKSISSNGKALLEAGQGTYEIAQGGSVPAGRVPHRRRILAACRGRRVARQREVGVSPGVRRRDVLVRALGPRPGVIDLVLLRAR